MPIIIQEIIIKAMVDDASQSSGAETTSSGSGSSSSKIEIVKECVEEVMRILNEKKER